jgi:hypothetical protein
VKVLTRTAKLLTATAVVATCVAGTVAAHDLPAVRAKAARTDRAAAWQRLTQATRTRRVAAEHRARLLRAQYAALVRQARRRDAHLMRVLHRVRRAKLRHWRHHR